ncbi:MAG TPA: hypothetical protein VF801_16980 [Rhodocyclaceae bacterium]
MTEDLDEAAMIRRTQWLCGERECYGTAFIWLCRQRDCHWRPKCLQELANTAAADD